ncbi:similar to ROOT GROWTH DEFECTIVE 3 [Actinidia rufa]|uniref:Similar to ROOT GROWTH DEFECTIVE 3 n=1 Tax=Actinidia rufa TaxID=165716 RepID=A0A7J0FRW1_9ERIC|nr:similar to ROOT GROWTH DEFECTIVE 3 [Actinidia rufa]
MRETAAAAPPAVTAYLLWLSKRLASIVYLLFWTVSQYLRSKNWDTRVAAAHAIGAIAANVKHTSLTEVYSCVETKLSEVGISCVVDDVVAWSNHDPKLLAGVSFRSFDINKVLEFGALLASGGQEYDIASDNMKNPKERLARQKQNLRRRLGLDLCEQFMDVNDMIRDEDLIVHKFNSHVNGVPHQFYTPHSGHNVRHLVSNMIPSYKTRRPSARELNLLKRRAKVNSKDQTRSKDGDTEATFAQDMVSPKGICADSSSSNKLFSDPILDEDSFEHDGEGGWPFHNFVEQLIIDMFDPGKGMTMKREREIDLNMQVPESETETNLKRPKVEDSSSPLTVTMISGSGNGKFDACVKVEDCRRSLSTSQANGQLNFTPVKIETESCIDDHKDLDMAKAKGCCEDKYPMGKMDVLKSLPEDCELMNLVKLARHSWVKNCEFLQDSAIRFLCVLSLDRFGDYVSDQVVAPVRETCAQALGAVLKYMHPTLVHETLNVLLQMQCRPEWEIRHGSLLGIKYLVAVRQEMLHDLLGHVLPACKAGLEDPDDDVRAVAADALLPSAAAIVSQKGLTLHSIVMLLWDILLDLDDLSPSTSSVMNLLAEIYSQEEMVPKTPGTLASKEKQEFDLNEMVGRDDHFEGTVAHENPHMLSTLAPRLWPFMRHSITSVRYSAIRTLERLLEAAYKRNISESSSTSLWPSSILGDTLRIVFQNLLLESNEEILHCSERVWRLLLQCSVEDLEAAAKLYFSSWIELAITPYGSPLDATKMFWPAALPRKSHFKAAAKMRAVKLESDSCISSTSDSAKATIPLERHEDPSSNPIKINCWPLPSLSGVQRQVASMVLISWFKEIKRRDLSGATGFISRLPNNFKNWLLDLLGCTDPAFPTKDSLLPYAELSRTYSKMRNEVGQLFRAVESSGMPKNKISTINSDQESLSADDAMSFCIRTSIAKRNNCKKKAAEALAELISHCIPRKPSPNDKLIKNLCCLTWMDPCETPQAAVLGSIEIIEDQDLLSYGANTSKQKSKVHMLPSGEDRSRVEGFISRRGSELALMHLCKKFGASLFDKIPKLWDCLTEVLKPGSLDGLTPEDGKHIPLVIESVKDPQILINNIQVIRSIAPLLDEALRPKLLTLLPCIFKCISHSHVAVRLAASRCITSMAMSMTMIVMAAVIENVIPMLGDMTSVHARQGAGMLVSLLVQGLGVELVTYAPLLVVPLLRCMSDCDHSVRQSVTHSFAALVPLLPLARGLSPPADLSEDLSRSKEDARFLEQLVDNSHIDDYKLSTELKVTLRRYQQEGINWLAFLKRFNLHGILCDDMGLGKTLQASAIVASDIAEHRAADDRKDPPPSLIICPSTLVGHWIYEIEKFIDTSVITTLQYVGSAQERISLRSQFEKNNVIVTSYDVVRKDVDYLGQLFWNYCILDEGHIIKNSKSKITCAVKQLKAQHRLILSGTPIQFQATYGKPLLAARDSKCSAKDAEAGALAMEALHKQVMPFLLRRTKDEVLSDLPEKIIQDRYCDLTPVQLKLYEYFNGSSWRQETSSMANLNELDTGEGSTSSVPTQIITVIQHLLKICSHPLLVTELHKLHHSPKLIALQEILEECGIGVDALISEGSNSVGQHRVLIFAQHKAFLDIIERDLFHAHMKR